MADTLELVEIPPDQKRLADDVLIRHESPVPAVAAAVAVVAHHEVIPGRHRARKARFIVGTILVKRESLDVGDAQRGNVRVDQYLHARVRAPAVPSAAG